MMSRSYNNTTSTCGSQCSCNKCCKKPPAPTKWYVQGHSNVDQTVAINEGDFLLNTSDNQIYQFKRPKPCGEGYWVPTGQYLKSTICADVENCLQRLPCYSVNLCTVSWSINQGSKIFDSPHKVASIYVDGVPHPELVPAGVFMGETEFVALMTQPGIGWGHIFQSGVHFFVNKLDVTPYIGPPLAPAPYIAFTDFSSPPNITTSAMCVECPTDLCATGCPELADAQVLINDNGEIAWMNALCLKGPTGPTGLGGLSEGASSTTTDDTCGVGVKHIHFGAIDESSSVSIGPEPAGLGFLSAQIPTDGFALGGNCRGDKSVDFQMSRSDGLDVAAGDYCVISGGSDNRISTIVDYCTIAGGFGNNITPTVTSQNSTIGGGYLNQIAGRNTDYSVVSGGKNNKITGVLNDYSGILGGCSNQINSPGDGMPSNGLGGSFSSISGGQANTITGKSVINSFIGAGNANSISGENASYSVICGGDGNEIRGENTQLSFIGSGRLNMISGINSLYSVISGGQQNEIRSLITNYGFIGGGYSNKIGNGTNTTSEYSTIGGGCSNVIQGFISSFSTIGGGTGNFCTEPYATIPGGWGLKLEVGNNPNRFARTACGQWNNDGQTGSGPKTRIFMVGNGTSNVSRSNAFSVTNDGTCYATTSFVGGGADYAEYFETSSGKPIPLGTSVTVESNGKIRPAKSGETPIGVISGRPGVIGDAASEEWVGKYIRDKYGSIEYSVENVNGVNVKTPKINPLYNPNVKYIPRSERPEWCVVGLMGKVVINKGQQLKPTWVKLKSIDSECDLWLLL